MLARQRGPTAPISKDFELKVSMTPTFQLSRHDHPQKYKPLQDIELEITMNPSSLQRMILIAGWPMGKRYFT
jgi:hypothetical protein